MKKLSKRQIMQIALVACVILSAYALRSWSAYGSLTIGSYLVSALIHIVVPMFFVWSAVYKKVSA